MEVWKRDRRKLLATAISLLGVTAIGAAFWASRDWLREEWWIHKLQTEEVEERTRAAMRLGEIQSSRAVPHLLGVLGEFSKKGEIELRLADENVATLSFGFPAKCDERTINLCVVCMQAVFGMTRSPGLESSLVEALRDESAVVRATACSRLERLGSLSEGAVLALRESLADSDPTVRKIAAGALERIRSP